MSAISQFARQYKIELSGILAWVLFTFAALRLIDICISQSLWVYFGVYSLCSLMYTWYFSVYYRPHFTFLRFLFIILIFNIGIHLSDFTYDQVVYLREEGMRLAGRIFFAVINLIFSTFSYFIIRIVHKSNQQ